MPGGKLAGLGLLRGPRGLSGATGPTGPSGPGGGGSGSSQWVANLTAARSLTGLTQGAQVFVGSDPNPWVYDLTSGSGLADNGDTILQTADDGLGENGRLYKTGPTVLNWTALGLVTNANIKTIRMHGRFTAGDGGGGTFDDVTGVIAVADDSGVHRTAGTRRWKRRITEDAISPKWFGAKCDGGTSDSTAMAATLAYFGDTTKLRSGKMIAPFGVSCLDATLAFNARSGVVEGAGIGIVAGGGTCWKWTGAAGSPMARVRTSAGLTFRDMRLTCLTPASRPSAAFDFNVQPAEALSNTDFCLENVALGGYSGDTIPLRTATIKNTGSTSPDSTITGSTVAAGIYYIVSTAGVLAAAKVKIATGGYSLDPTSTTWIDAGGAHVDFASAHEFPISSGAVAIPATAYVLNFLAGTYVLNDSYRYDAASFDNGIVLTGVNSQNDQFTFRRVKMQAIRDVCIDIQNGQSTTGILDECKFNDARIGVQTKSRILNLRGGFMSTIYEACIRQLADGGVRVTDVGAEGCARFIHADAGVVEAESCYFQPNARMLPSTGAGADAFIWQNGLDDTNGHCFMRLSKSNYRSDGTLGGRIAKVKISGCKTAVLILEEVGFEGETDIDDYLAHIDMATVQSGQSRMIIIINSLFGVRVKYWEHGDHGNEINFTGYQFGTDVSIRNGKRLIAHNSGGAVAELIQFIASGGYAQIGGFTTPVKTADLNAITSGVDVLGYRSFEAQPGLDISVKASSGQAAKLKDSAGNAKVTANDTGWSVNGVAPTAQRAYTAPANHTDDRALDETGDTLPQVANVLGTLVKDLQEKGIIS